MFQPWYSSFPVVENNLRYSFTSYVRVRSSIEPPIDQNNGLVSYSRPDSSNFEAKKFSFLPKEIFERHEEYLYLNLVKEIISDGTSKDDRTGTGTLSRFGVQVMSSYHLECLFFFPTNCFISNSNALSSSCLVPGICTDAIQLAQNFSTAYY